MNLHQPIFPRLRPFSSIFISLFCPMAIVLWTSALQAEELTDAQKGESTNVPQSLDAPRQFACGDQKADYSCVGSLLRVCDNGTWKNVANCQDSTCSATAGACIAQACDPNVDKPVCIDNSVAKCNRTGTGWNITEECGNGNTSVLCRNGRCTPDYMSLGETGYYQDFSPTDYVGNIIEIQDNTVLHGFEVFVSVPDSASAGQNFLVHWRVQRAEAKESEAGSLSLEHTWKEVTWPESPTEPQSVFLSPGDQLWISSPFEPIGLNHHILDLGSRVFGAYYLLSVRLEPENGTTDIQPRFDIDKDFAYGSFSESGSINAYAGIDEQGLLMRCGAYNRDLNYCNQTFCGFRASEGMLTPDLLPSSSLQQLGINAVRQRIYVSRAN